MTIQRGEIMKKFILLSIFLLLSACGRPTPQTPTPAPRQGETVPQKETTPDKVPAKTKEAPAEKEGPAPEADTNEAPETKEEPQPPPPSGDRSAKNNISYPIFTDAPPLEQQPKNNPSPKKETDPNQPSDPVNQLITVYIDELDNKYNSHNSNLKADFTIMHKDSNYASILFEGELDGAEYVQDFFSTLNIDLKTGARTQLNQIILIDGDFIDIVYDLLEDKILERGGDISTIYPHGIEDLVNQADKDLNSEIHSYFTPSKITLIFTIPHEYGDYVSISVPNRAQEIFD